ncbi:hypothetical protein KCU85_g212, partial [Aureobasidium melanogenum]
MPLFSTSARSRSMRSFMRLMTTRFSYMASLQSSPSTSELVIQRDHLLVGISQMVHVVAQFSNFGVQCVKGQRLESFSESGSVDRQCFVRHDDWLNSVCSECD